MYKMTTEINYAPVVNVEKLPGKNKAQVARATGAPYWNCLTLTLRI